MGIASFVLLGGLATAIATLENVNPFVLKSDFSTYVEVTADEIYWAKFRYIQELKRDRDKNTRPLTKERSRMDEAISKETVKLKKLEDLRRKNQRSK